jgi:DNA repair protein RecO (recombination protein O)
MPSAGPRSYRSSRAFLVRSADAGEIDRRISFFTESAGLVVTLAKAASRSRKRFGGALQKYLLLSLSWTEAPGRMAVLGSTSLLESFWEIAGDWERVRHADYLLELTAGLFPQPGPKPKAFALLLWGLRSLALGVPPGAVGRKTEAVLLAVGGWGPDLSACRRCGRQTGALRKGALGAVRFLMHEGGFLCGDCSGTEGAPLSLGAVKTWKTVQASTPALLGRVHITEGILNELQHVIPLYVALCLGKPLRSLGGPPPF